MFFGRKLFFPLFIFLHTYNKIPSKEFLPQACPPKHTHTLLFSCASLAEKKHAKIRGQLQILVNPLYQPFNLC